MRRGLIHKILVAPYSTRAFKHNGGACPDTVIMSPHAMQLEATADDRRVYVKNTAGEAVETTVLCDWHTPQADDWSRVIGPPSNDTCWTTSGLWQMLDPGNDILRVIALDRREQFTKEHLLHGAETDVGLAMLAMYDAANGQRAAHNWDSVARIVAQMDDLLRRDYLPAVPDRSKDKR